MTANKKSKKIKIGTILDAEIYERLKKRAAEVGRPISDILQEAIIRYEQSDDIDVNVFIYALLAAVAERLRVQSIVSADNAFSRIRGIVLYSPNDVGNS